MRKAQGALEYLIIIAAVLGISAVVVLFITGTLAGSSGGADISKCRVAAANCKKDMATGLSTTCPYCDTACKDASGKDLLDRYIGCGLACQQCKQGTATSGGSALSIGLVGQWKFDQTAGLTTSDSSGQGITGTFFGETIINGTLANNPARVAGKYGNALSFNGINTYVDMGNAANLNPTDSFTVMAWVNTADSNPAHLWDAIVSKDRLDYPNKGWRLVDRAGYQQVMMGNGTGYSSIIANWIADGSWHHWAATLTSKRNMALYLDGVNVGNTVLTADFVPSASNLYFGNIIGEFNGVVDSVRFFNRSLSQAEIQVENSSSRPTSRAVGVWEFDESSPTTAEDTHIWVIDGGRNGISFDGIDDYIQVPRSAILESSEISVVVRVKNTLTPATTTYDQLILSKDTTSYTTNGYALTWGWGNDFFWRAGDGTVTRNLVATSLARGSWYHIVGTFKNGEQKLYVNGALIGTNNLAFNIPYSTSPLYIGKISTAPYRLQGVISEVRIYNRTLSSDEVVTLYNS